MVKEKLELAGVKLVKLIYHEKVGEVVPECYEIVVNTDTIAFIYNPDACFSYNIVNLNKQQIKVASIDTMLYFCYSFYYSAQPYYNRERILCITNILYAVELENRLNQRGLLKRFSTECVGSQRSYKEIKEYKAQKFKELVRNRNTREYHEWFLKYHPSLHKRPDFLQRRRGKFQKVRFSKKNRRDRRVPHYWNTSRRVLKRPVEYVEETSVLHRPERNGERYDTIEETPPEESDMSQRYDTIEETSPEESVVSQRNRQIYDTIEEYSRRRDTPFIKETSEEDDIDSIREEQPVVRRKRAVNKGKGTKQYRKYKQVEQRDNWDDVDRKEQYVDRNKNMKEGDIVNVYEKEHKKRRKNKKQTKSYAKKMFDLQRLFGYKQQKTKKTKKVG
jgi:hypothetical protein